MPSGSPPSPWKCAPAPRPRWPEWSRCSAYLFANRRANRMKVLVHDGVGIWLAARLLNQGKFHWPGIHRGTEVELDPEQLQALVFGLPWQRVGADGAITVL
ncbi:IS66 family insertion sequence element accessory protein TnpB [Pseudomonas cichorii]|uniref:IS66 family insertion sequence element accessory protein TnpB n=1 Tax=Pseudomonas cichorii TaxID=36746 RepID=UPI0022A6F827|nr:IS66 family insertion sequence element accessory protein TnpB [Pseudomonas cichorii]